MNEIFNVKGSEREIVDSTKKTSIYSRIKFGVPVEGNLDFVYVGVKQDLHLTLLA